MDEERFNPFTEAIRNKMAGVQGVLRQIPPPENIRQAVEEYDRRVADPQAYLPEWQAILELQGPKGLVDYLEGVKKVKETWGL